MTGRSLSWLGKVRCDTWVNRVCQKQSLIRAKANECIKLEMYGLCHHCRTLILPCILGRREMDADLATAATSVRSIAANQARLSYKIECIMTLSP